MSPFSLLPSVVFVGFIMVSFLQIGLSECGSSVCFLSFLPFVYSPFILYIVFKYYFNYSQRSRKRPLLVHDKVVAYGRWSSMGKITKKNSN